MRKYWLDNLRWVTVLTVLIYHVIYYYNNKGVLGGIGGFGDGPQYQDAIMYILYPWFMMLMFLIAGISARYAVGKPDFLRSRTVKLLVPSTIGLMVFQWITGYINTIPGAEAGAMPGGVVRYVISVFAGIGPLWFIQDLWVFSLLLVLIRKLDGSDRFWKWCGRCGRLCIILLGLLVFLSAQAIAREPVAQNADELINLYRPVTYFTLFLLGYFVFSHDKVQEKVKSMTLPMLVVATVSGIAFLFVTWPMAVTGPAVLSGWLCNLFAWTMILAMMGAFMSWFDTTGKISGYMTRSSYGIYIVHYVILSVVGYALHSLGTLPPLVIYMIQLAAMLLLSPAVCEIIKRIPLLNWCVLGIRRK